jgi:hypothetical protein
MSESPAVPNPAPGSASETSLTTAQYVSAQEIEKLAPETKAMVSLFAGIVRSTTGPDPETAKVAAQSEMHEETCRLEGYKESLKTRDRQSERDHEFRKKRLNHDTARNLILYVTCLLGIGVGLYLYIAKGEKTIGSNIVTACFVALLGGKALLPKDKE